MTSDDVRPVATLWQLALAKDQPRMMARTQALRDSLKRRGWREMS